MYVVWFGKICLFHYHFPSTLYHLYVVLLNLQMVFVLMKNIKLKKPRTGPIPTVKGSLNDLCSLINNLFLIMPEICQVKHCTVYKFMVFGYKKLFTVLNGIK